MKRKDGAKPPPNTGPVKVMTVWSHPFWYPIRSLFRPNKSIPVGEAIPNGGGVLRRFTYEAEHATLPESPLNLKPGPEYGSSNEVGET